MTNNASPLRPTRGGARYDYLDTPRPVFTEGKNGMPALVRLLERSLFPCILVWS